MRELKFLLCFFEGVFFVLCFFDVMGIEFILFGGSEFVGLGFLSAETSTSDVFALSFLDDFLVVFSLKQILKMMKTSVHVERSRALI
jgi:hypothetical protein